MVVPRLFTSRRSIEWQSIFTYLYQIVVRISKIYRGHFTFCAMAINWTKLNCYATIQKMHFQFLKRPFRNQAKITSAGCGMHRFRIKGVTNFVNIDLLASEVQRRGPASRIDPSETQSAFVKFASFLDRTNCQHDVVYPVDHQAIPGKGAAAPEVMDV